MGWLSMIRVVMEVQPNLYALSTAEENEIMPTFRVNGQTYYRVHTKQHYVFYKPAISGWGAAAPNPADPRPVFNPEQR
jgi:hypothetical protein